MCCSDPVWKHLRNSLSAIICHLISVLTSHVQTGTCQFWVKEHINNLLFIYTQVLVSLSHTWWHFWSKDQSLQMGRDKQQPPCTQVCRVEGFRGRVEILRSNRKWGSPMCLETWYHGNHSLGLSLSLLSKLVSQFYDGLSLLSFGFPQLQAMLLLTVTSKVFPFVDPPL